MTNYFVIKLNSEYGFGTWKDGQVTEGLNHTDGCSSGAYIVLPDGLESVTMYVGLSYISIEQARTNLQLQTNMLQPFDSIRATVQQKWLDEISRFEVWIR